MKSKLPLLIGVVCLSAFSCAQGVSLPQPPQVRAKNHVVSVTLHAVNENGKDAFAFNGKTVAPVIRASPGDVLKITYINDLPSKSPESCAADLSSTIRMPPRSSTMLKSQLRDVGERPKKLRKSLP